MPDEWDQLGTVVSPPGVRGEDDEWSALGVVQTPGQPEVPDTIPVPDPESAFGRMFTHWQTEARQRFLDEQARRAVADEISPDVLGSQALAGPRPIEPFARGRLSEQMLRNFGTVFFDTPIVPFRQLNVTPQQVSDALDTLASGSPDLSNEEAAALQEMRTAPDGLAKVAAGTQQAINQTLESLTTPFAVGTLGTGALLKGVAGRLLAGFFATDMARHAPAQLIEFRRALDSGDPEAIARTGVGLGLTGTFLYGAAKHAATPDSPARAAGEQLLKALDDPQSAKQLETAAHEFALRSTLPDQWDALGVRVERSLPRTIPKEVIPNAIQEQSPTPLPGRPTAESIQQVEEQIRRAEEPAQTRPAPTLALNKADAEQLVRDLFEGNFRMPEREAFNKVVTQLTPEQRTKYQNILNSVVRRMEFEEGMAARNERFATPDTRPLELGNEERVEVVEAKSAKVASLPAKWTMTFEEFLNAPREGELLEELRKVPRAPKTPEQEAAIERDNRATAALEKAGLSWVYERSSNDFSTRRNIEANIRRLPKPKKRLVDEYEAALTEKIRVTRTGEAGQRRLYDALVQRGVIQNPAALESFAGPAPGAALFADPGPVRPAPTISAPEAAGAPANAPTPAAELGSPIPPNAPATPPPGTPGTAQLFDMRLPVTLPRTAGGAVSVPQVMKALENVVVAAGGQTPIRVGRFNKARARGVYNPQTEVTRINSADNIPTATHEIGHASQKLLYGSAYASGLKGLPPAIKKELVALGRALYGSTRPAAGYTGEGWAEFIRHYITTDDAAKVAPATEKFFREKVLQDHPDLARAVKEARDLVDVYQAQGSVSRAQQQLVKAPGTLARIVRTIRDSVSFRAQVDEFEPLWKLSQGYEERTGHTLVPASDPFLLASWKRGTAGAVVETMVNDHMIDPWGNPLLAPGNMSLKQALAPIKGRSEDFALYLFGRRALERWSKNKNPGITREDAQYLVQHFDSPEFQLAAQNYYQWNDGLLEYVAAADPAMRGTIDAIRASSGDYAPLARVIDPAGATAAAAAARSNPLLRMHGSGRQVRDIFEATLENAARLVSHAHRKLVLESIVKLSKKEGMGFLVEEVPRAKVKTEVNFEKLREQLEDIGVDTSAVDDGTVLSYFDLADKPKGADPIVVVKEMDGLHWYHVSPDVYQILNGLDVARLPGALDLLLGAPARAFRLGTTGLRASFSLFTNPVRDLRTFIAQTQSDANPARLAASYLSAMGEVIRAGFGGRPSPHVEAFYRLGAQLGQPLGIDIRHTRRAARGLFHGKVMRVVTNPIDQLRDLLQITESGPRVAELKLIADEVGWKPGQPITPDQAVQMALAAKRATVDFSAAGRISKVINQAIPFYNATIQGSRSFARALRDNPTRAILVGLTTITVPALLNWWRNKDEEWYRQLPWRERYLYDNLADDRGNVWQIPRPPEWGNVFAVLPEAMFDSWYRQDPRGAGEALQHIVATTSPADYPVLLKIAKEQWQNRIEFFDRPIVPRSQVDLPPGEQRGPYTTKVAEWIGDAFPNQASPRRIDAAVRGYFGGAVPDLLDALGLGARKGDREQELSDLPVLGRMFRRGGEFSVANQAIGDYYDELTRLSARIDAQDLALREGRLPAAPLDEREYAYGHILEAMRPMFKLGAQLADRTSDQTARQRLYQSMGREAERLLKMKPKKTE